PRREGGARVRAGRVWPVASPAVREVRVSASRPHPRGYAGGARGATGLGLDGGPRPPGRNLADGGDHRGVGPGADPGRALRGLRDHAAAAPGEPRIPADAVLLCLVLEALDDIGRGDRAGPTALDVPQLLRPAVATSALQLLGPVADPRLRRGPLVARDAAQRRRWARPGPLRLLQRGDVLHAGLRR